METLGLSDRCGRRVDPLFWAGKRVFLTGHTGFKGAWASLWLAIMGAEVTGFSLAPPAGPSLFAQANVGHDIDSIIGDVGDFTALAEAVARAEPEIVLHLAAQPLVRRAFAAPVETFATNVIGTIHLLETLRHRAGIEAILVITTDKVYANAEDGRPFIESDRLGGHDPYAASKAAVELVVASYAASYFETRDRSVPIATARGGNVIGGGDFSLDRVVPDIWRSLSSGNVLRLRYPGSTRPWQHVLDCLSGYFLHAEALVRDPFTPRALNFGPDPGEPITVGALVDAMQTALGSSRGWEPDAGPHPREMDSLALDPRQARLTLGWRDQLPGYAAIGATAAWYKAFAAGADMGTFTRRAIIDYGTR